MKDLEFSHRAVIVREGKGGKDRVLMLPQSLVPALHEQLGKAHVLWTADRRESRRGCRAR